MQGEEYFDKLNCSGIGTEQIIDEQVFMNLVTFTDAKYVNMRLDGIGIP